MERKSVHSCVKRRLATYLQKRKEKLSPNYRLFSTKPLKFQTTLFKKLCISRHSCLMKRIYFGEFNHVRAKHCLKFKRFKISDSLETILYNIQTYNSTSPITNVFAIFLSLCQKLLYYFLFSNSFSSKCYPCSK